jgi:alanyl-tRNA synthetase
MGTHYQALKNQETLIIKVIGEEETSFFRTLEQGIKRMDHLMDATKKRGENCLVGSSVFELYDTYGFPLDLIQLMAREHGFSVDEVGFDNALAEQKERSRAATGLETDDWQSVHEDQPTIFVGYDANQCPSKIIRYRKVSQKQKVFYQLALDNTPFYAESGGQVGDTGWLLGENGQKTRIFDVKKENNLTVHLCESLPETIGQEFEASIDVSRRDAIRKNHSATHLLHYALRRVLGPHVEQKGSLVAPDYLRFDFSHFSKVTEEEMGQIVSIIEQGIEANYSLNEQRNTPLAEAQKRGAMALFGEKYGETVRVIQFGESIELCGGTHVSSTGEIGIIHIQSETAIAAGIRRIEMITGKAAEGHFKKETAILNAIRTAFKNPKDIAKSIQDVMDNNASLGKEIEKLTKERNQKVKTELLGKIEKGDCFSLLCVELAMDSASVKDILFQLKGQIPSFVGIVGNHDGDKCGLTVILSDNLVTENQWDATAWIREASPLIQGGGGGQSFFATAGGKNPSGIREALTLLRSKL